MHEGGGPQMGAWRRKSDLPHRGRGVGSSGLRAGGGGILWGDRRKRGSRG